MAPIGCDHIIHGYKSRRYDMFLRFWLLRRRGGAMHAWSMPWSSADPDLALKAFRLLREKYDICVLKFKLFPSPMPTRRPTGRMTSPQSQPHRAEREATMIEMVDSSVIALKEPSGFTERQGSLYRCRSCHAELLRARRAEPRLVLVLVFRRCTVAKARDVVGLRASVATD